MLLFSSLWHCLFLSRTYELMASKIKTLWNALSAGFSGTGTNLLPVFHAQGVPFAGCSNGFVTPSPIGYLLLIAIIFIGFFLINQRR